MVKRNKTPNPQEKKASFSDALVSTGISTLLCCCIIVLGDCSSISFTTLEYRDLVRRLLGSCNLLWKSPLLNLTFFGPESYFTNHKKRKYS